MPGVIQTSTIFNNGDSVTSTKLNSITTASTFTTSAVSGAGIVVTGGGLLSLGTVSSTNMAVDSVLTASIANSNVTTAKIADLNVTTGKIADLGITTIKIADLNVTASKIAVGAIIGAVPSNFPIQIVGATKTDIQVIAGTIADWVDVSGLSVTLTRAIASASGKVRIQASISSTSNNVNHSVAFRILRGTTVIGVPSASGNRLLATSVSGYAGEACYVPVSIDFIDTSPGSDSSVVYKIQARIYSVATGYINRSYLDSDVGNYVYRTISTLTITELSP